ncbi:MAG: AGE family epimerase/isomerase [Candidatus Brocadiae bacterium]|nr:AGE family epimerase/isomerase [Candidatus Brocadiia bacterium]
MRKSIIIVFLLLCIAVQAEEYFWKDETLWKQSKKHSIEFMEKYAWDEESGSYASEILFDGTKKSEIRHLIALSRMIYGLSNSLEISPSYLVKAQKSANFLIKKMMRQDAIGPYFLSSVYPDGSTNADPDLLIVNEQAYGFCGLVALYEKTKEPYLLHTIRVAYRAFYKRFHDSQYGGFFDAFSLSTSKPIEKKSYNSTVYVATSFLFALSQSDVEYKKEYESTLLELGEIILQHFLDQDTGWIIENFDRQWKADWRDWQKQGEYTIGVVGHNFQAAWLLLRIYKLFQKKPGMERYAKGGVYILESMLKRNAVDNTNGGFFDVLKRETSENMWHTNKAWWQQAEGILALTLAEKLGLLKTQHAKQARNMAVHFYFRYFVDRNGGGEFSVVEKNGNPIPNEMKAHKGKSTYHTVEMAEYMLAYIKP